MSTARCCANCIYWKELDEKKSVIGDVRPCGRFMLEWDISEWDKVNGDQVVKDEYRGVRAFTQDNSDYYARLYTLPNFFCIEFKAK